VRDAAKIELVLVCTMLKHDREEFHNDLRAWPNQNLPLASLFSVANALETIVQNTHAHHL